MQAREGQRIELVRCTDLWTKLPPGATGTVVFVDSLGTVHVKFDNGVQLGLVAAAGDRFKIIDGEPGAAA